MPSRLSEAILRALDGAQASVASHPKHLVTLVTLYEKTKDPTGFFDAFFPPFSNVLLVYKREPAVERVVSFVSSLAVKTFPKEKDEGEDEEVVVEDSFFSLLVDKLLSLHKAKDKAIRFRVCQLVSKLVGGVAEENYAVDSQLLIRIQEAMLMRLLDKIPVVRVHAVAALEFLQEPGSNNCPVTLALLELMAKDTSPDVRKCVLNKIQVTDQSLAGMIERTRDTKEVIRHDAFVWLADKCKIRNFTISKRIQLLRDGLNDLSEMVVTACVNGLLRTWSMECNNGDFITLLARLDVESFPEVVELALCKLFANFSIDELVVTMSSTMNDPPPVVGSPVAGSPDTPSRGRFTPSKTTPTPSKGLHPSIKVLPRCLMKCEEVFYWSSLCRYLHGKGREGEEGIEKILPTLSEFCNYIKSYVLDVLVDQVEVADKLQAQFVTQQLCSMLAVLDLTDEVGRCQLSKLVSDLLVMPKFPTPLIGPLLEMQTQLWPEDAYRIEKLAEAIAELRQPSTLNSESGRGTSVPPGGILSEESYLSSNLSFLDLQDDPDTLLRCLTVTCELLKGLKRRKLDNPMLLTLVDSLLFPCIQNENPYVRDMALHCLGLASLLDLTTARNHILLFLQVSQVDHESVQATALKIVFDLLHVYGFEAFNITPPTSGREEKQVEEEGLGEVKEEEEEEEGDREESTQDQSNYITQRLLGIMAKFLEGESMLLREISSEGICKLLLSQRIMSQPLLAKLLLLWYNPISQDESQLRSVLGLFFPSFAAVDRKSLSKVYLPVMKAVAEAPPTSPLASINANNLSDFIVQLTRPTSTSEESVHDSLACDICDELLDDPVSSEVRVYCRTLSLLDLTPSNTTNAANLLTLWEKISCVVEDKTSLRYLNKFGTFLKRISPKVTGTTKSITMESELATETTILPSRHIKSAGEPTGDLSPADDTTLAVHDNGPRVGGNVTQPTTETAGVESKTRPTNDPAGGTVAKRSKGTKRKGRKKIVLQQLSSTEEESEGENIEPEDIAALPSRRSSKKTAASPLVANDNVLNSSTHHSSHSEESDDSVVGEHSPFVKHTTTRRRHIKALQLQYSDEEEELEVKEKVVENSVLVS